MLNLRLQLLVLGLHLPERQLEQVVLPLLLLVLLLKIFILVLSGLRL